MLSRKHRLVGAAAAVLAGGIAALSCSDDPTGPSLREVRGQSVNVGNGTARTVVTMLGDSAMALAIELSTAALEGLPTDMREWTLPLPADAPVSPFDHATLDWNPTGHPPQGIYSVPHFDFHFYMVTPAEQAAVAGGPRSEDIPAEFVPPDYAPDPVAVPAMGVHWTDTTAKEFHGQPFTSTFIYGSYQNEFTFLEPMATLEFLASHPTFTQPLKVPGAVQRPGRYPVAYSIRFDASTSTVRVSLDGLVRRE